MPLDDIVANPQAQAGTSIALGSDEGLEEPLLDALGDAATRVRSSDADGGKISGGFSVHRETGKKLFRLRFFYGVL